MQVTSAIFFAVIFLCMHIKLQPYAEDIDDDIQSVALGSTFLTLMSATMVRAKEGGATVMIFILAVNLLVMVFGIWTIFADTIPTVIEEYELRYLEMMEALEKMQEKMEKA